MHRSRSPLLVLFTALVLSACGPDQAAVSPESASTASSALASGKPGKAPCHRWQACVPENPCHTGWVTGCRAGEPICTDIGGWLSNGTTCGDAAVCFMGECTPCAAGAACQVTDQWNNPLTCRAGAIQCATGQPVCADVGTAPDGATCVAGGDPNSICDGGQCVWCAEGSSCQPPDQPCHVGAMSCSTGAHCLDTGATQPDGYYCGYQQVCSGGTCTYCESGMTCSLPEMPCWYAATTCSSGAPVCAAQWPLYPGYPCGVGLICDGMGACVPPCNQGASCFTGNLCEAGFMSCWSSTSGYCQPNGPLPDGTGCGDGMTCQGGICQAACVQGSACTSPDPCRPFATMDCGSGLCLPTAEAYPDGTGCGFAGETCQAGTCTGVPGARIVVRSIPGPSVDLTGTSWSQCLPNEPQPGQSRLATDTYGVATFTHVDEIFPSNTMCQGEPDPAQRFEASGNVTLLGDRLVGWLDGPPPGLPDKVTATALEAWLDVPGSGLITARGLIFIDGRGVPRMKYEGKDYPGPDGVPTRLGPNARPEYVAPSFTMDDLEGEWDVLIFSTNPGPGWAWFFAGIDLQGRPFIHEWLDSSGATAPPPGFDFTASIDGQGTVSLTGAYGGYTGTQFHGAMTAGKTLIFATDQKGDPGSEERHLWVWRNRVPFLTFSTADLASATYASHAIYSGNTYRWQYGAGFTDSAGSFTLTNTVDSLGVVAAPGTIGTFEVDTFGVVTMAGQPMRGVMTPDKNSVFMVQTTGDAADSAPALRVLQRTGQSFVQADLAGAYAFHGVTSGPGASGSGWNHGTATVDESGLVTFRSYLGSGGSTTLPPSRTYTLSPSGALTQATLANFHGQLAWERDYYVRTSGTATAPYLAFVAR